MADAHPDPKGASGARPEPADSRLRGDDIERPARADIDGAISADSFAPLGTRENDQRDDAEPSRSSSFLLIAHPPIRPSPHPPVRRSAGLRDTRPPKRENRLPALMPGAGS